MGAPEMKRKEDEMNRKEGMKGKEEEKEKKGAKVNGGGKRGCASSTPPLMFFSGQSEPIQRYLREMHTGIKSPIYFFNFSESYSLTLILRILFSESHSPNLILRL